MALALIENLQREDLSPLEEAGMYDRMIRDHGYSIRKLADKLGKDKGYLENRLRLADAPEEIRELVSLRKDTLSHAYELMKVEDPKKRRRLAELIEVHVSRDTAVREADEALTPTFVQLELDSQQTLANARAEGIVPAPEPTHALAACIREALACKESGEEKVILTALCGHGHFDLSSYERYLSGSLEDYEYPAEKVKAALAALPGVG